MSVPAVMRGSTRLSQGLRLWAVKNAVYLLLAGLVLLGLSGRIGWAAAWAYLVFLAGYLCGLGVLLYRRHPGLLAERSGVQPGTQPWDVVLASLSAVWLPLALYAVAGLDQRFGWSPAVPGPVVAAGGLLLLVGAALSTWAMLVNEFFSAVVRLQDDRGQVVVTGGPYRFVRHPGYLGSLLLYSGVALLLGSVWALAVVAVLAAVLVVRTAKEDRFLHEQLAGYPQYARRVRFRLLPGLW